MSADQLHGVTETLERAAGMAGTISSSIEGHRQSLRPTVDALQGQWEGTARPAFDAAYQEWELGITRLTTALNSLGENTRFSSVAYVDADEAGRASMNQAQNASAFGGALRA